MPDQRKKKKPQTEKPASFEAYVKKHGEEEIVPFDDVLKNLVSARSLGKKGGSGKSRPK